MWKLPGNLRHQIALILLLAILPLAGLAIYLEVADGREEATRARADSHATVNRVAEDVNRAIESSRDLVLGFSRTAVIRGQTDSCSAQLAAFMPAFPQFANMGVIDRDANLRCAAANSPELRLLKTLPEIPRLLDQVRRTRGVVVGSFVMTRPGKQVVPIAGPVMEDDGEIASFFVVTVDLGWLNDRVNAIAIPEGAVLLVMNSQGAEIARNPRSPRWPAGIPAPPLERTLVRKSDFDSEVKGYDGISRFYSVARADATADFQVVMKTRVSAIYRPAQRRLAWHLGGLTGVGLLVLGLTWIGGDRYFRHPLSRLIQTSDRLASGNLEVRSGLSYRGEMGVLARSFDQMAETLERNRAREREAAAQRAERLRRLKQLAELSMTLAGDPGVVFERLVRVIGDLFAVRGVCLTEIAGDRAIFRAIYVNGQVVADAGSCPLEITPCAAVAAGKEIRIYERVQELFPAAAFLRDIDAYLWCGFPSLDNEGNVVGVTCLVDDKPREFSEEDRQILWVIGQRIATEFDRARRMNAQARMEEALREHKRDLEEAQQLARLGSYSSDQASGKVEWSDEMYRIHEMNRADGVPAPDVVLERVHPDDRGWIRKKQEGLPSVSGRFQLEYRLLMEEGRIKHVIVHGSVTPVKDGQPHMRGILQDITERKQAEEEKQQLQNQLNQAQKMESIGRLAGGIAHDFNNLLTVVIGYSQMLRDQAGLPEHSRRQVEEIHKTGIRAGGLTQQLLAFSRKQVIMPRSVNLNEVISEIVRMLQPIMGEDILITTTLAADLGSALVDPDQMHQVVMNLAVNARDAMPHGGSLHLETANASLDAHFAAEHPGAVPGPCVLFTVRDSGAGMDPGIMHLIFEPFFTTKPVGHGTGLGLATVHGIVRQSGGWIVAGSEPGKGTSFRIYLPRVEAAATGSAKAETNGAAAEGAGETILVVEDQDAVREFACDVLCDLGYNVLKARGGEDALRIAGEAGAIHLMITDVVMPGMSGLQLADRFEITRPGMKVLFASGYAEHAVVRRGAMKPGSRYLPKPFSYEALGAKVREMLD